MLISDSASQIVSGKLVCCVLGQLRSTSEHSNQTDHHDDGATDHFRDRSSSQSAGTISILKVGNPASKNDIQNRGDDEHAAHDNERHAHPLTISARMLTPCQPRMSCTAQDALRSLTNSVVRSSTRHPVSITPPSTATRPEELENQLRRLAERPIQLVREDRAQHGETGADSPGLRIADADLHTVQHAEHC